MVLILPVVVVACGGGPAGSDDTLATTLRTAFATAEETGEPVDIGSTVGGAWDRVVFVCPYEDADVVTERLGFEWQQFPGADQSEVEALFVFADDAEVITWTQLSRPSGDPCTDLDAVLQRDQAVVEVTVTSTTTGGDPFRTLARPDAG